MSCKLTKSLNNTLCAYSVAGARKMFLANYFGPLYSGSVAVDNQIVYTSDVDGNITHIYLPGEETFYELDGAENTISFSDVLLAGANGAKYRQHTVNAILNKYDHDVLDEGDALSLGKFIAVVIDNAGRIVVLGRTSGLSAPAGGFDYNSGAALADATGWTVILQGGSKEIAPLLLNEAVITPIFEEVIE